jgi:hypothetical protein
LGFEKNVSGKTRYEAAMRGTYRQKTFNYRDKSLT